MKSYVDTYCGACPIFMKTISGKIDELVVEFGVPAEEIACYGCRSEQLSKDWCRDCFIKTCCREKILILVLNAMIILVKILLFFMIIRTILTIKNMNGVLI